MPPSFTALYSAIASKKCRVAAMSNADGDTGTSIASARRMPSRSASPCSPAGLSMTSQSGATSFNSFFFNSPTKPPIGGNSAGRRASHSLEDRCGSVSASATR